MKRTRVYLEDDYDIPWLLGFGSISELSPQESDEGDFIYVPSGKDWAVRPIEKPRRPFGFQHPRERQR